MKNSEIFSKTMPFVLTRFGLYLGLNIGIIVYLIACLAIFFGAIGGSIGAILVFIAVIIGVCIYIKVTQYINYLVKAAHVAVISELAVNKTMPEGVSVVKYGQEQVKKRFVAASVFYGIDSLVSGAVKQIQTMISRVGSWFGNIEAVQNIVKVINMFIGIVLGYVDEAVLARIFHKKEEGAWKGAAYGVVLYFQNWKEILKNAVGIVIFVIIFYVVGTALTYGLTYGVIIMFAEESILATLIAIIAGYLIIDAIKQSFVDSYITISVVNKYMSITYNQVPAVDLYEKAKGWSKKFSEMCSKAESEIKEVVQGAIPVAATTQSPTPVVAPQVGTPVQSVVQPQTAPVSPVSGGGAGPAQQPVMQTVAPSVQSQVVSPQPVQQVVQPAAPVEAGVINQTVVQPQVNTVSPVGNVNTAPVQQPVTQTVAPSVQPQTITPQPVSQNVQPVSQVVTQTQVGVDQVQNNQNVNM